MTGRQLTTGLTLCCLVAILVGMAVWGYRAATRPLPDLDDSSAPTHCSKEEVSVQRFVHRNQVTVSVFNAGAPSGFAAQTLSRLEDLGFRPGAVANAPEGRKVARVVVYTTSKREAAARLVARTLGRHVPVRRAQHRFGPGVDVFVGSGRVRPDPKAPRRIKLDNPIRTCIPVE